MARLPTFIPSRILILLTLREVDFFKAETRVYTELRSGGDTNYNYGTFFRLTTNQISFLHIFDGTNRYGVESTLIQAGDGNLYGVGGGLGTNGDPLRLKTT